MFELHPRLREDAVPVGEFSLSLLLLSKDANYPWCILVPKREDVFEIHHLSEADRQQLMYESCYLSEVMTSVFAADKMNVAALGNQVKALHVHHVVRFEDDPAWPNPIWGVNPPSTYTPERLQDRLDHLRAALVGDEFTVRDSV